MKVRIEALPKRQFGIGIGYQMDDREFAICISFYWGFMVSIILK